MDKIKILFVCHGNICRSPMAEYIMKEKVRKNALSSQFIISSKATSCEEIGNDIYPPAKKILSNFKIPYEKHYASQVTKDDYDFYDYILVMDYYNLSNIKRIVGFDDKQKIKLLLSFAENYSGEISNPWYSGNFEKTYQEIMDGCEGLLKYILENH